MLWVDKMAHQMEVLDSKPDDPSSISRTHTVERELTPIGCLLTLTACCGV